MSCAERNGRVKWYAAASEVSRRSGSYVWATAFDLVGRSLQEGSGEYECFRKSFLKLSQSELYEIILPPSKSELKCGDD